MNNQIYPSIRHLHLLLNMEAANIKQIFNNETEMLFKHEMLLLLRTIGSMCYQLLQTPNAFIHMSHRKLNLHFLNDASSG